MNPTKQRKILLPLLAAGTILLLVCGILGGYAVGFAKGRTAAEVPAETDQFLYVEGLRTYEGDVYVFPDRYPINEDEWLADCQIPRDVMEQLTTRQLFESSLHCPLYRREVLSSTILPVGEWMQMLAEEFNGMQELRHREDLGAMLVCYFREMTEEDFSGYGYSGYPLRAAQEAAYFVDSGDLDMDTCLALRETLEAHTVAGGTLGCAEVLYDTLNCHICGEGRSPALWNRISGPWV